MIKITMDAADADLLAKELRRAAEEAEDHQLMQIVNDRAFHPQIQITVRPNRVPEPEDSEMLKDAKAGKDFLRVGGIGVDMNTETSTTYTPEEAE